MDDFWDRVDKLLIEHNQYRRKLAEAIGVSESTVTTWHNSKIVPRADRAVLIAQFLDTSVEYLVTGENPAINQNYHLALRTMKEIIDKTLK